MTLIIDGYVTSEAVANGMRPVRSQTSRNIVSDSFVILVHDDVMINVVGSIIP
jgi:hypothetical protein